MIATAGWVIRFQTEPRGEPSQIIIHVRMLTGESRANRRPRPCGCLVTRLRAARTSVRRCLERARLRLRDDARASCCARFSRSSMRTWMMICEGSPLGSDLEPNTHQPWQSSRLDVALGGDGFREDEEPRGAPRLSPKRSRSRAYSWSSMVKRLLTAQITFGLAVKWRRSPACRRRKWSWPRCPKPHRRGRTTGRLPGQRRSRRMCRRAPCRD